ncbi:MAG TPA: hypothetical protein VK031_02070 [Tissierellaceae bacterium]|nr:hypothetical protein [Tissierellaceae bacterium]
MIWKILDENIERSNKLGKWISPDVIDYTYWEVRYILPDKLSDITELINYICDKHKINKDKLSQAEIISFFLFMKDSLVRIAEVEQGNLQPRVVNKSKFKPSPRAKDYPAIIELNRLSGGCPIKAKEIKEMKYSEVFETLLALTIESEGTYDN